MKINPTSCFDLEMCDIRINAEAVNENEPWPAITIYCIYGHDTSGNKNGDVKRFYSRDALNAWSILHPDAKNCGGNQ